MEAVQAIHEAANEALGKAIQQLDKQIRPVQRAYFSCCFACSDASRPAADVPSCIAACQQGMIAVQTALGDAQETFQGMIGKCHGVREEERKTTEEEEGGWRVEGGGCIFQAGPLDAPSRSIPSSLTIPNAHIHSPLPFSSIRRTLAPP